MLLAPLITKCTLNPFSLQNVFLSQEIYFGKHCSSSSKWKKSWDLSIFGHAPFCYLQPQLERLRGLENILQESLKSVKKWKTLKEIQNLKSRRTANDLRFTTLPQRERNGSTTRITISESVGSCSPSMENRLNFNARSEHWRDRAAQRS